MTTGQWDYSKGHGPTCDSVLVMGRACNCPYGAPSRVVQGFVGTSPKLIENTAPVPDAPDCYKTVRGSGDIAELDKECSRLIALGWVPHGNMVIAAHFDQRGVFVIEYYQPMVRTGGFFAPVPPPEPAKPVSLDWPATASSK